jgi:hypothetical protein
MVVNAKIKETVALNVTAHQDSQAKDVKYATHVLQTRVKTMVNVWLMVTASCVDAHQDSLVKDAKQETFATRTHAVVASARHSETHSDARAKLHSQAQLAMNKMHVNQIRKSNPYF